MEWHLNLRWSSGLITSGYGGSLHVQGNRVVTEPTEK
jgi:hypothetical protein